MPRSLLRLGKAGATETHARSLAELLAAHKLVKVQINGPWTAAAEIAAMLSERAGGALVLTRGATLLFSEGGADPEGLLRHAEESVARAAVRRERRSAWREKRQGELAVTNAKREANASRSRKQIGKMISSVSNKGELTRESLRGEWQQLAQGIAQEEAGEEASLAKASAPAPKQPWKRREAAAAAAAAAEKQLPGQGAKPARQPRGKQE